MKARRYTRAEIRVLIPAMASIKHGGTHDRDMIVIVDFAAGETTGEVAKNHVISSTRVRQIIQRLCRDATRRMENPTIIQPPLLPDDASVELIRDFVSVRAYNCFVSEQIKTVGDVRRRVGPKASCVERLIRTPNFGRETLREVQSALGMETRKPRPQKKRADAKVGS